MSGWNPTVLLAQCALALVLIGLFGAAFVPQVVKPLRLVQERDWTVWTVSSMARIGRSDPPQSRSGVNIRAARGEYEAFQVVVSGGSSAVTSVDVEASDMAGPEGSTIPRESLALYREHYVQVTHPSPDPGRGNRPLGIGWYPDALIPIGGPRIASQGELKGVPFDVGANTNQPLWVDVHVPFDAHPGTYTGTLRVSTARQERRVPISLRVWDFAVPLKPTLKSSFGMHEPSLNDRRVHELLLQHRVMPVSVNPRDAAELEEQFGLNITGLRFWGNSERTACTMDGPPEPAQIASALNLYPRGMSVYIYPADEIDRCPGVFSKVRGWAAAMHAADARIMNLVTVSPTPALYYDGGGTGRPAVDIWALLPKAWEAAGAHIRTVQAKGGEVWSYTALVQDAYSPKWEIDFAPVNYRIQPGFISQSLGLTGILYWRVDLWTAAPYQDLRGYTIESNFYPGEGMLVYPGGPAGVDGVVPSMRLKWIREGVEDFEYVAILKRLGRGEWALERARRVGPDWRNWTQDPSALERVRNELGDEIERLSSREPASNQSR